MVLIFGKITFETFSEMHTDDMPTKGITVHAPASSGFTVHEFIKYLKTSKVFTLKQSVVIDNVFIYFEDLNVYKVVLQINPSMMKKAKRLNINSEYITAFFDGPTPTKLKFDEDVKHELDKGRFIAIYDIHRIACSVYPGEETEDAQVRRIQ